MRHSARDTLLFAAAVCVVCSLLVSASAVLLRERQAENRLLDRRTKVLRVAGLLRENERISREDTMQRFERNLEPRVIDLRSGAFSDEVDAASFDQRRASRDPKTSRRAPKNPARVRRLPEHALIYLVKPGERVEGIILPVEGMGLWSTLYGYLALAPDTRTIRGITFYEHAETPGLGGEVNNPRWKARWPGRLAFDEVWQPRITVVKGRAGAVAVDPYHVDGLSGATLTSNGVTHLLHFWLGDDGFGPFLSAFRRGEDSLALGGAAE